MKNKVLYTFCLVSALILLQRLDLFAQNKNNAERFINNNENIISEPIKIKYDCGPLLQNVTDTSFTVVFTTNMNAVAWVEVAPDDNTHWYNRERKKFYDMRGCGRRPITKIHKITVKGLQPNTTYRYRILMKGVIGQFNRVGIVYTQGYGKDILRHDETKVHTRAHDYDKLHIGVVNDMHEGDSILRKLFSNAKEENYDFVAFNGDMTSAIDNYQDVVTHYLKSSSKLFASDTPLYMIRGNHEYRGNDALSYLDFIDTPTNKPYYTAKYGDFFFIFLDTGEDKEDSDIRNLEIMATVPYLEEEKKWLENVVNSNEFKSAKTRIVFGHIQPNPNGWYGSRMVAEKFVPILNKAGIDLMLCGHIHKYKFYPIGSTNAQFPVLCNNNRELMIMDINKKNINLKFYNPNHNLVREKKFSK